MELLPEIFCTIRTFTLFSGVLTIQHPQSNSRPFSTDRMQVGAQQIPAYREKASNAPLLEFWVYMVELVGIEPTTSSLRTMRSPS
jgi:hypothetical protein